MLGRLDPANSYRELNALNAERTKVTYLHTPSTIEQNQELQVILPSLADNDSIYPDTAFLSFDLELTSTVAGRHIVQNVGRNLVTAETDMFEGQIVNFLDRADIWRTYSDLWLSEKQRELKIEEGLDTTDSRNVNKIRVGVTVAAATNEEKAVAAAYGDRFKIPLGFELLKYLPYSPFNLLDKYSKKLRFSSNGSVMIDAGSGNPKKIDGTYKVKNLNLEFEKVRDDYLASQITDKYQGARLPFEKVELYRKLGKDKSDTEWNISINTPCTSLTGVCILFVDPDERKAYESNTEKFYNPKIKSVDVSVEGVNNQLYDKGMKPYDAYIAAQRYFANTQRQPDVTLGEFFTDKFSLFFDFRTSPENGLHGGGIQLKNTTDGINLHIKKKAETAGSLDLYVYTIKDAMIHFNASRRFERVVS